MAPLAIAGAGPIAQSLGHLLARRGHVVVALASRSPGHAEEAARFVGAGVEPLDYRELGRRALPTIIAVSDTALPEVAGQIASTAAAPALVLHTCGVAGPDVLAPLRERGWSCGVLHPLQTVPSREQGIEHLVGAPFGIGGDSPAVAWAETLVRVLEGRPVLVRASGFALYHAAAVLAGNGIFALLDAATGLLVEAGVPREAAVDALGPLCRLSLANALGPAGGTRLTGPVARGDVSTISTHLAALSPLGGEAASIYRAVTVCLLQVARHRGLSPSAADQITHALAQQTHGEHDGSNQSASS